MEQPQFTTTMELVVWLLNHPEDRLTPENSIYNNLNDPSMEVEA